MAFVVSSAQIVPNYVYFESFRCPGRDAGIAWDATCGLFGTVTRQERDEVVARVARREHKPGAGEACKDRLHEQHVFGCLLHPMQLVCVYAILRPNIQHAPEMQVIVSVLSPQPRFAVAFLPRLARGYV